MTLIGIGKIFMVIGTIMLFITPFFGHIMEWFK
jgi:hypothetical protein